MRLSQLLVLCMPLGIAAGDALSEDANKQQPLGVVHQQYRHGLYPISFDDKWLVGGDIKATSPKTSTRSIFRLYELNTGKVLQSFEGHTEDILNIKISADRKYAVTAAGRFYLPGRPPTDATARLWDMATGKEVMKFGGLKSRLASVYLSPDNQRLLTIGAEDTTARLWDVKTGKQIEALSSWFAQLSPDGQMVLVTTHRPNRLTIWDSQTGTKKLAVIEHDKLYLEKALFDPTSSLVLTYELAQQPTLRTWDAKTGKSLQTFAGHTSYITDACFTPDGQMIASASEDKTVRLWNTKSGKEVKHFKQKGPLRGVLISGDGKRLYASWVMDTLFHGTLWDLQTGKEMLETDDFVGFSPDGSRFLMQQSLRDLLNARPATWFDSQAGKAIQR
jgi:WD40 repeat protein